MKYKKMGLTAVIVLVIVLVSVGLCLFIWSRTKDELDLTNINKLLTDNEYLASQVGKQFTFPSGDACTKISDSLKANNWSRFEYIPYDDGGSYEAKYSKPDAKQIVTVYCKYEMKSSGSVEHETLSGGFVRADVTVE